VSRHLAVGNSGEDLAARFLKGLNYRILERNVRNAWGEIDLVAQDRKTIVFVEVKTRSTGLFGGPRAAVNADKQRRMSRAAQAYLSPTICRTGRPASTCWPYSLTVTNPRSNTSGTPSIWWNERADGGEGRTYGRNGGGRFM
jgi:uncharacterized protein (TIGR00252 family)